MSVFDSTRFHRKPKYTSLDVRRAALAGRSSRARYDNQKLRPLQAAASRLEIEKVLDQHGGADSWTVFQDSTRRDLTGRASGRERIVRQ
jgi:hypothetical protein